MAAPSNDVPAGRPGRRRWPRFLIVLGVLLLATAWWVDRQLEPKRLTALVLREVGQSQGLDLAFSGEPDYAFRPEPRLLVPNLVVRQRGGEQPFLQAERVEVSLPWDTLIGGEPVVTRIELGGLALDLPGLRRWQASRPPTPFEVPTLLRGLRVSTGRIADEGWSASDLALELPRLAPGQPASATVSGVLDLDGTRLALDLVLGVESPGLQSSFTLSGPGELRRSPRALPFRLQLAGRYRTDDGGFTLDADEFDFVGDSPLPTLQGRGALVLAGTLAFSFDGHLREWANGWPALPAPLSDQREPMPLQLRYSGASDLADPMDLALAAGPARLQARLRVGEMSAWLEQAGGSPLPPLEARLESPSLVVEGFAIEGATIEIRRGEAAATSGAADAEQPASAGNADGDGRRP